MEDRTTSACSCWHNKDVSQVVSAILGDEYIVLLWLAAVPNKSIVIFLAYKTSRSKTQAPIMHTLEDAIGSPSSTDLGLECDRR